MNRRRTLGLAAVVAAGISAVALVAGKAGAESTTSLRGTIALTGFSCACPSDSVQVYLLHLASGKLSQLTHGPVDHEALGWSPDGSRLLVGETGPSRQGLYSMRADGSSETLLAKQADTREVSWSPDGRRVAYLASGIGTVRRRRLYVINADGTHRRLLTKNVGVDSSGSGVLAQGDFSWAPNGKKIVFARPGGLFTITTTGKPVTHKIISVNSPIRDASQTAWHPSWSPDGTRIAFTRNLVMRLVVIRSDGSHRHVLQKNYDWYADPVWSPNSSWIAGGSADASGGLDFVSRSDGTRARSWRASWSGITFSPDSTKLAYVGGVGPSNISPNGALYIANTDGSRTVQVLNVQSLHFLTPLWRGGTAETETGP